MESKNLINVEDLNQLNLKQTTNTPCPCHLTYLLVGVWESIKCLLVIIF